MVILALVFIACAGAGVAAGARWLPDLAPGPVGGLAFFVVCGLLGAALGLVGLHIFTIVEELNRFGGIDISKADVVATGLESMLWEAGSVFGLASAVYLLAPAAESAEESVPELAA
jgi:phosphotransferase system  glucose/maltose/N-acetylglucosamine-specific IIC component